uniref:DNA topoisomerase n=1 Tax=Photinus pyralis TaxID=7054 RepID=A0A1Y1LNG7_PHOPY
MTKETVVLSFFVSSTADFKLPRWSILQLSLSHYWSTLISLIVVNHTMKDLTVDFNWKRDRLFDKNACEAILDICQENPQATVEEVESKSKSKWRPLPLDTVELEKTASRKLRINAKDTMKIAEKLYTQGLISYPRTETNIFPRELNLVPLVEQQTVDNRWGPFAQRVLNEGGPNPRQGRKSDQAHPPIHPTKYANNLNGNEQRIYEYIVRHFLACVSKDAMGHETVVHVDIADEKFLAKGLFILERNYLDVYTYDRWNAKEIHEYRVGETFMPSNLSLAESTTSPPKLLTEADLIALMEKYGIGTDATHAEHIETIKTREYVGLHENIYFVPGTLGMGLVEGYNRIGLEVSLAKPNLRADFEKDLKLICDGHKNPETVRREQIEKYRAVFGIVTERILEIDDSLGNRLEDRPRPLENEAIPQDDFRPVMKCPKCNGDLVIRNRKTGTGKYLSCTSYPQCKNAIWLPVSIDTIEVLEESCNICGPTVKKLRVKFKHNPFLGEPNPNTICIGGCDNIVLDTLNISASSVRGANRTNAPSTNRAPTNNRNVAPNQSTLNNWVTGSNRTNSSSQPSTSTRQATSNDTRDDANASLSYSNAPTFPMPAQTARPTQTVRPSNPGTSNSRPRSFLDAPTPRGQQGDVANGPNANVCSCNQEATLLTVRKEGPNKGRQFYACPNRSCNYFAWASESEPNAMRQNAAPHANAVRQNGAPTIGGLKCDCNLDAAERIVSKDGPNKGRRFFCCPKPMGEGCRFFKWADDVNGTNGNDNGHDPYNGPGGAPNTSWNSGGGGGGGGNWRKKNTNWKSKKKTKSTGTLKPYNKNATQRKPKTCGICRQEGHIRTNCPNQRN